MGGTSEGKRERRERLRRAVPRTRCFNLGYLPRRHQYGSKGHGHWSHVRPGVRIPCDSEEQVRGGNMVRRSAGYAKLMSTFTSRILTATLATLLSGALGASPSPASAIQTRNTPPSHRVEPVVFGNTQVGQFVRVSNGTWSGGGVFQFSFQWYACSTQQTSVSSLIPRSCTKINGATNTSFWPQKAQKGKYLAALITARNSAGTGQVLTKTTKTKIT